MFPWSSATPEHSARTPQPYSIGELLPQAGRMLLLDEMLEAGPNHIAAALTVRDGGLFSTPERTVPAWIGLEYMAQAVAAFSGFHRRRAGLDIDLGFLLGTRYYECSASDFPCGCRLQVFAEKVMDGANDMSVFACRLEGERIHAEAKLNLFLPRDARAYLAGKGV